MSNSSTTTARLKGLLKKEAKRRELQKYPVGRYRVFLLFIVVFANIIASYEGNLAPIVPLLLEDLNMSVLLYGQLNAVTLVVTAITSIIFGVIADRWGRSLIVIIGVLLTAIFIFVLAGITTVEGFFFIKVLLGIVDGLSLAPIAGLVRDFSPQVGRGLAFAFWSLGPVGGPFIANFIATWTLPIYGTWQSQLYIMAGVSIVLWVVIVLFLRDLSPEIRSKVYVSEPEEDEQEVNTEKQVDVAKVKFTTIFAHPVIWLQPVGISIYLILYFTMTVYGPLLFTEVYNVAPAMGSKLTMYCWLGTFFGLVGAGWLSDRLKMRKICTLGGALLAVTFNPIFIIWGMRPETTMTTAAIFAFLSGFTIATAYSPWMAMYSENLEKVNPYLQATGWGLFGLAVRFEALLVALFAPIVVSITGTWKTWFIIAQICMMIYIIFPFFAFGSWFPKKVQVESIDQKTQ